MTASIHGGIVGESTSIEPFKKPYPPTLVLSNTRCKAGQLIQTGKFVREQMSPVGHHEFDKTLKAFGCNRMLSKRCESHWRTNENDLIGELCDTAQTETPVPSTSHITTASCQGILNITHCFKCMHYASVISNLENLASSSLFMKSRAYSTLDRCRAGMGGLHSLHLITQTRSVCPCLLLNKRRTWTRSGSGAGCDSALALCTYSRSELRYRLLKEKLRSKSTDRAELASPEWKISWLPSSPHIQGLSSYVGKFPSKVVADLVAISYMVPHACRYALAWIRRFLILQTSL